MNLGINLLFLEPGKVGGSETFAREILDRIDNNFAKKNKVFLYCSSSFLESAEYKNIILKPCIKNSSNRFWRLFFEIFILPLVLIRDKIVLLHSMGYTSPIFTHCKKIVTIFDTQFKSVPYTVPPMIRYIYSILMPLVVWANDLIITSSQHSKKELVTKLNANPQKITVTPGAAKVRFTKPVGLDKRGNYIMTSAATYRHKNVDILVKAFHFLITKYDYKDINLYITGFPASDQGNLRKIIGDLKLTRKVKFLGWVSREKYFDLLRKSKVFVFPSSYEGFGLPPLEAMTVGTPVISSNKTSLAEVLGNAAIVIEPKDPNGIAEKINTVLKDKRLYKTLIAKGINHAKFFSWDRTYDETIKTYMRLNSLSSKTFH